MHVIEVLGTGCPKCRATLENVERAVAELGIACEIVKVTDLSAIIARGVMMTPAVVVDGRIISSGRVPSVAEVKQYLTEEEHGAA